MKVPQKQKTATHVLDARHGPTLLSDDMRREMERERWEEQARFVRDGELVPGLIPYRNKNQDRWAQRTTKGLGHKKLGPLAQV